MLPASPDVPAAASETRRAVLITLVVVASLGLLFGLWQWTNSRSAERTWNLLGMSALWASILTSNAGAPLSPRKTVQRTLSALSIALSLAAIVILLTRLR